MAEQNLGGGLADAQSDLFPDCCMILMKGTFLSTNICEYVIDFVSGEKQDPHSITPGDMKKSLHADYLVRGRHHSLQFL